MRSNNVSRVLASLGAFALVLIAHPFFLGCWWNAPHCSNDPDGVEFPDDKLLAHFNDLQQQSPLTFVIRDDIDPNTNHQGGQLTLTIEIGPHDGTPPRDGKVDPLSMGFDLVRPAMACQYYHHTRFIPVRGAMTATYLKNNGNGVPITLFQNRAFQGEFQADGYAKVATGLRLDGFSHTDTAPDARFSLIAFDTENPEFLFSRFVHGTFDINPVLK